MRNSDGNSFTSRLMSLTHQRMMIILGLCPCIWKNQKVAELNFLIGRLCVERRFVTYMTI